MPQDPMSDVANVVTCDESRSKQYHDARIPATVSVTVTVADIEHEMRVCSTPRRGAKIAIELTTDNLDVYGYATPPTTTTTTNDERRRRRTTNDERRLTTTAARALGASSARRRSSC